MATGLKLPVGVNKSGGAAVETNSGRQLKKLVNLALSEGGDDNPFQNLGLPLNIFFKIKDPATRAQGTRDVDNIMRSFPERIGEPPQGFITIDDEIEAALSAAISYIDLEKNTLEEFATNFAR